MTAFRIPQINLLDDAVYTIIRCKISDKYYFQHQQLRDRYLALITPLKRQGLSVLRFFENFA
jgi:hypothetical protein